MNVEAHRRTRASSRRHGAMVAGAAALGGLGLVATLGGGAGVAAAATPPGCGSGTPRLTVSGTGVVTTTPNILTLYLSVSSNGTDVGEALSTNDAATQAVVTALTTGGVASKDIQTTNLSIQPIYAQPIYAQTGRQAVTGYTVDNTVVATVRHLPSAGALIDAAVAAGGNDTRVGSLTFSVTDPRGVQDRARSQAVRQAVAHASSMARAAGEHVGPICSLKDTTSTTSPVFPLRTPAYGAGASPAQSVPSVPVQPGSQKVQAQVDVVYALDQGSGRS